MNQLFHPDDVPCESSLAKRISVAVCCGEKCEDPGDCQKEFFAAITARVLRVLAK